MNQSSILDELMGFNKSKENLTERNSNNSSNLLKELMEAEMVSGDKVSNF